MDGISCSGFTFYNQFDSANLGRVILVPPHESPVTLTTNQSGKTVPEIPHAEFNVWTRPDCFGTEFQNGNRTWFYFGIKAQESCLLVRLNIVDLNRQGKMYSQGMAPVYRVVPGKLQWDRIRDKPSYSTNDDIFTLSFKFKTPENPDCVTYFAFTYPFSYDDLQKMLTNVSLRFRNSLCTQSDDEIYYKQEVVCHSLQGREITLITISSYHGITSERETRLKNLFPNENIKRPNKFVGKKYVFLSARVHPGETPSSFVFNGFLNLLLTKDDPIAIMLRRLYVFKLVPFLNPDGVALGHYRTDTRGINLNRVYLNPLMSQHPSIYAARSLILYYHYGEERELPEDGGGEAQSTSTTAVNNDNTAISTKVSHMTLEEPNKDNMWCLKCKNLITSDGNRLINTTHYNNNNSSNNSSPTNEFKLHQSFYIGNLCNLCKKNNNEQVVEVIHEKGDNNVASGLFLYIDLHGHASKKGIFMYGNHFDDLERNVECMLLPKLMSLNNHNFHFTACNFTERNMYLKDRRDGMSREGSGRVAVLKLTGLTKSYTLECNYNTGRYVNVLAPTVKEPQMKVHSLPVPPKFSPPIFEEVGRSLGASILDLTAQNPCTRIPNSEFHTLTGLKEWLRINCIKELEASATTTSAKLKLRSLAGLHNQGKTAHGKARPTSSKCIPKRLVTRIKSSKVPIEKKENVIVTASSVIIATPISDQPCCSHSDPEQRTSVKAGLRLKKNSSAIKTRGGIKDFAQKLKRTSGSASIVDKQKVNRSKLKCNNAGTSTTAAAATNVRLARNKQHVVHVDKSEGTESLERCFKSATSESGSTSAKFKVDGVDVKEIGWNKASSTSKLYVHKRLNKKEHQNQIMACKSSLIEVAGTSSSSNNKQIGNAIFGKSASAFSKTKFNKKHSFRRLTSASDNTGKVEKTKSRKKIKISK